MNQPGSGTSSQQQMDIVCDQCGRNQLPRTFCIGCGVELIPRAIKPLRTLSAPLSAETLTRANVNLISEESIPVRQQPSPVQMAVPPSGLVPAPAPTVDAPVRVEPVPINPARVGIAGVTLPASHLLLPRTESDPLARTHFLAVHGGAGASTMTAFLPETVDAGGAWPCLAPANDLAPPTPVLLVARTHAHGLVRLQNALREHAAGAVNVNLLGVVLIADIPERSTPKSLRDLTKLVANGAPADWRIPYLPALRLGEPASPETSVREIAALAKDLSRLTRSTK